MKKPWEETWSVHRGVLVSGTGDDHTNVLYEKNLDAPEHVARARLAAAAPEMARLLVGALRAEGTHWCIVRERIIEVLEKAGIE